MIEDIIQNKSILAIPLASISILVFRVLFKQPNKSKSYSVIAFIVLGSLLLIIMQTRAALVGFLGAMCLTSNIRPYVRWKNQKHKFILPVVVILFSVVVFFLKKDSSLGRILIYIVSVKIFLNNWVWGIGIGKFKVEYNLWQAKHFASTSIDGREAVLADNTFYAFNDSWQLIIELGILKVTILILLFKLLYKYFRFYTVKNDKNYLFDGTVSGLLCILIASFFSYPLQTNGVQLLFVFYLYILLISIKPSVSFFDSSKWINFNLKFICIGAIIFLGLKCYNRLSIEVKRKEIVDLSRAGFLKEALNGHVTLYRTHNDARSMFEYSRMLFHFSRIEDASKILEETKRYYTDNEIYKFSATLAIEQGKIKQAEQDLLTAVYMVPNRMQTRYELMNFYLNIKDTTNALHWGRSILQMPVKVTSLFTEMFLKNTRKKLDEIEKVR